MQQTDFYCKTYCPLSMLCPSSGAQELYRGLLPVVHGTLVYRSLVWCGAVGLCVPSSIIPQPVHINLQLHTRPTTCKPKRHAPQAATICITLEVLIVVPETCRADNKFCDKNQSVESGWPFIFHVLTTMHSQTHIKFNSAEVYKYLYMKQDFKPLILY